MFGTLPLPYPTLYPLYPLCKGWATTLCSEFIWKSEREANLLCESGLGNVLDKCMKEVSTKEGRNSLGLAQSYNALWALCTGNGQHAEIVIQKEGFPKP